MPASYIQALGTNSNNTSGTTLNLTFTGTEKPAIGELVVISCVRDNITNDPATGDSISTSPGGNTYTRVALAQPAGTSTAAAGLVGVFFYSILTANWPTGTNTVTWTCPSVSGKAARADHYRGVVALRGTADTAGSTSGSIGVTTTDPLAGDVVIAFGGFEHSTASTVQADLDATNGSWSAQTAQVAGGGTNLAGVKVVTQYKNVTAAGSQIYNATNSATTSVDTVGIVVTFSTTPTQVRDRHVRPRGGSINSNFY